MMGTPFSRQTRSFHATFQSTRCFLGRHFGPALRLEGEQPASSFCVSLACIVLRFPVEDFPMTPLEIVSDDEPTAPAHGRPAPAGSFVLTQEIDGLRNAQQYRTSGHAARTLFKRPELRVVLIVLRRDAELKEHKTNQPVSIQTLMGRIGVALPDGGLVQDIGGLMVIEPGVMHDIRALSDSAFLLSMPWSEHAEG
jgi:quercetin dioxygenase-like cupin family protein